MQNLVDGTDVLGSDGSGQGRVQQRIESADLRLDVAGKALVQDVQAAVGQQGQHEALDQEDGDEQLGAQAESKRFHCFASSCILAFAAKGSRVFSSLGWSRRIAP